MGAKGSVPNQPRRQASIGSTARIAVRLAPRASRDAIGAVVAGELIVRVTAPPLDGRANEALTRLLAKRLHVGRRGVKIVSGQHSRRKVVQIDGMTEEEVRGRL
jgi:uncharacterized protein